MMTDPGINRVNGLIPKESITEYTNIYTQNNRKQVLPLDETVIAIFEGINFKYTGIA